MKYSDRVKDEALIAQLDNGDPVALAALYKLHGRFLYSVALRITKDPHDAEEVLQDTFLKLWRKSSHFKSARGSLLGWLITITRNGAIDRIRHRDYRFDTASEYLCDEILPNVGTSFLNQHIARELVSAVLADLPSNQREAVTLGYFEGWTCEEIAARTGTPLGTIKTRLRSALKTMKCKLSDPAFSIPSNRTELPVMLETVLITEQLYSRACRSRSSRRESEVFDTLARVVASCPEQLIDFFLKMPIALCRAGTAGLSLLEGKPNGEQVFRWTNLAGRLAKHVGGSTPRNFSPCGVTLDCDSPQLFAYPGRYFHYFDDVDVPIVEGLVIPFRVGESTEGTVWIVSHEERRGFDSEDVRIMTGLAEVVGCALHLMKSMPVGELARAQAAS